MRKYVSDARRFCALPTHRQSVSLAVLSVRNARGVTLLMIHGKWWSGEELFQGSHLREKTAFLTQKKSRLRKFLKMPCVYCTQKTVTSHIKMRLVFSFFAPSRGLYSTCRGSKHPRFPPPPPPSLPHHIPVKGCWCLRYDVHDTHRH